MSYASINETLPNVRQSSFVTVLPANRWRREVAICFIAVNCIAGASTATVKQTLRDLFLS